MNTVKKIFFVIICLAAAAILAYGIKYAVTPVASAELEEMTVEDSVEASGYIVREESAYYSDRDGRLYKSVTDGSRVAKDSLICTIYDSSVTDDVIQTLGTLDKRIEEARENTSSEGYNSEGLSVENEIVLRTSSIIEAARSNSVSKISQYKNDINSLRSTGSVESSAAKLEDLESEKAQIEAGIAGTKTELYAENSGVLSTYNDGLENKLKMSDIESYTVADIQGIEPGEVTTSKSELVKSGDFIASVVNNHIWDVILIVPTDKLKTCEVGDTVSVRFLNIANDVQTGTVKYITSEEQNSDGNSLVTVEFTQYFEGAFSYRQVSAELIFNSYSGFKIQPQAIHTGDNGELSVIALKDGTEKVCRVELVYSDSEKGFSIVKDADNTDNSGNTGDSGNRLEDMDRIVVGER